MSEAKGSRARKPVQTRSKKTKNKILASGRELFSQKGYQRTNSKEIARTAGVATGSFYAYFPDKGAVFFEITELYYKQIFDKVRSAMEDIDTKADRRSIISGLVMTLYDAHNIDPDLHREISMMILAGTNHTVSDNDDQCLYRKVNQLVKEMDKMVHNWLCALLMQWGLGSVKGNPNVIADLIFRTAEETIHRLRQFPESISEPKLILQELIQMLDGYLDGVL